MSADNWTTCPRCLYRARATAETERAAVMDTYGLVPVDEFDAARAALSPVDEDAYTTLREDYEFFGADKGEVQATYSCGCTICGLGTELEASRRFWSEGGEKHDHLEQS